MRCKTAQQKYDSSSKDTHQEWARDKTGTPMIPRRQEEYIEMFGSILYYHQETEPDFRQLVRNEEERGRAGWKRRTSIMICR